VIWCIFIGLNIVMLLTRHTAGARNAMLHALYGAVSIWLAKVSAPLPLSTAKEATVMVSWFPTTSHSCSPAPGTSLKLRGTRPAWGRARARTRLFITDIGRSYQQQERGGGAVGHVAGPVACPSPRVGSCPAAAIVRPVRTWPRETDISVRTSGRSVNQGARWGECTPAQLTKVRPTDKNAPLHAMSRTILGEREDSDEPGLGRAHARV
jgi:hypothetical protein